MYSVADSFQFDWYPDPFREIKDADLDGKIATSFSNFVHQKIYYSKLVNLLCYL